MGGLCQVRAMVPLQMCVADQEESEGAARVVLQGTVVTKNHI